jgi:hypothetical protein
MREIYLIAMMRSLAFELRGQCVSRSYGFDPTELLLGLTPWENQDDHTFRILLGAGYGLVNVIGPQRVSLG